MWPVGGPPAVRPVSPAAHALGEVSAGSLMPIQKPVAAEQGQRKMLDDAVRHKEGELLGLPSSWRGSRAWLFFLFHDAPQGTPFRPELPHRPSPFRRRPPPLITSPAPVACTTLPDFQKQTGAVASPWRSQGCC